MNALRAARFDAQKPSRMRGVFFVLTACFVASLVVPAHGQLTWMRSDKKGGVPAGTGTKVRLRIPAGDKVTFYTSDFPPISLNAPGVTAKVSLSVTFEGDLAAMGAENTRFFGLGLFNNQGTSPGNNFADDSGYFFTMKGVTIDSGMIELRKRLGNGKSPSLNPSGEARANIGSSKDIQAPGTVTENVPYQIVFRLARTAGGISFGEGRGASTTGVSLSGGGAGIMAYSTNPDANPETVTFNQFGIFVENRSKSEAYIDIDSLQLELRKDGQLLSMTTRPSITTPPQSVVTVAGSRVVFNTEATGGALTFQWKKNNIIIPGAVNTSYIIEESSLDDGGAYSVVVSNPYGEVESAPAVFQLKQLIALKPGAAPVEQVIFEEDSVDVKPVLKKTPRIRYPSSLKERGVKGDNVLRFIVTSEGYVEGIQVAKFADSELIDPLMAAYQKARYKPAQKNGKPVCVRVSVTIPYPPADK